MSWKIILTKKSQKEIKSLDKKTQLRIKKAISEKLIPNADLFLEPLSGTLGGYYKFRIGNYRLICCKEEKHLTIIIIEVDHRSKIYKK
jgi:mRNA interferase RelE/StbE